MAAPPLIIFSSIIIITLSQLIDTRDSSTVSYDLCHTNALSILGRLTTTDDAPGQDQDCASASPMPVHHQPSVAPPLGPDFGAGDAGVRVQETGVVNFVTLNHPPTFTGTIVRSDSTACSTGLGSRCGSSASTKCNPNYLYGHASTINSESDHLESELPPCGGLVGVCGGVGGVLAGVARPPSHEH